MSTDKTPLLSPSQMSEEEIITETPLLSSSQMSEEKIITETPLLPPPQMSEDQSTSETPLLSSSQMSEITADVDGEIRDVLRALVTEFKKLDDFEEFARLTGTFDQTRNSQEVNKQLDEKKQWMIKELKTYVARAKMYTSSIASGDTRINIKEPATGGEVKTVATTVDPLYRCPNMTVRRKIYCSTILFFLLYFGGCIAVHWTSMEPVGHVNGAYFCIVTLCSVGYGDITPKSTMAKILVTVVLLFGVLVMGFLNVAFGKCFEDILDFLKTKGVWCPNSNGEPKRKTMVIYITIILLLPLILLGLPAYFFEKYGLVDSVYLAAATISTVGYGDLFFKSTNSKILVTILLVLLTLIFAKAIEYLVKLWLQEHAPVCGRLPEDFWTSRSCGRKASKKKYRHILSELSAMGKAVTVENVEKICKDFDEKESVKDGD